jgi:hypothetical protein
MNQLEGIIKEFIEFNTSKSKGQLMPRHFSVYQDEILIDCQMYVDHTIGIINDNKVELFPPSPNRHGAVSYVLNVASPTFFDDLVGEMWKIHDSAIIHDSTY